MRSVVERDARPPIFLPFYSFTFLLLTSFFTFLLFYSFTFNQLFYSFTFKSESSFHHNQVFFSSQLSLLFVTIKSSFLKEDAYFSDYECTSRSTPEVHPKYIMRIMLILTALSVIFSKKVYLCTFFWKIIFSDCIWGILWYTLHVEGIH